MLRLTLLTNPDKCNLHCPLCFLEQRHQMFGLGEMPFEVAKRAVESAFSKGFSEVIPSTMGEPLLYSHFDDLLYLCRAHNVPVNLTTNGSFPGKWGYEEEMAQLLTVCSDIKVSCMGWGKSFAEMMPGLVFDTWKKNVERLVECRKRCYEAESKKAEGTHVATVSLQVALHRKNFESAVEILQWAESIGISRIKWNLPVFLSVAPADLRERYGLLNSEVNVLRTKIKSDVVRCEGSLFFKARERNAVDCPFTEELWILPDGSEQRCPNPERRFGNPDAELAKCENCPMRG